jgi:hypothetical protein
VFAETTSVSDTETWDEDIKGGSALQGTEFCRERSENVGQNMESQ